LGGLQESWPSAHLNRPSRDGGRQAAATLLFECVRQASGVGHLGGRAIGNARACSVNRCRPSRLRLSGNHGSRILLCRAARDWEPKELRVEGSVSSPRRSYDCVPLYYDVAACSTVVPKQGYLSPNTGSLADVSCCIEIWVFPVFLTA